MDSDEHPEKTTEIVGTCRPYSLLSEERLRANVLAVRYVNRMGIQGDIVEVGVWKGGSMLAMILGHDESPIPRLFHLYDTFVGMTEPAEVDAEFNGTSAQLAMLHNRMIRCISSLEEVKGNIARHTGVVPQYHEGDILLNTYVPKEIAVLRLDTDWYESTKVELEALYPLLQPGGVLIIDDYGHHSGARKAVDEYFKGMGIWMHYVDYTCRLVIKK